MTTETVFLSSTARDLAKHREAVYRAIEGLDGYHCKRMEDFGARDREADDFCRAKVAECDLLVGIVGHLYGSCPPGSEQSYTEQEYEAAVIAEIPRLMFLAPEDFPLPAKLIELDEKRQKQRKFRERVSRERLRDTFTSPDDLAGKVRQAIFNLEKGQAAQERRLETEQVERSKSLSSQVDIEFVVFRLEQLANTIRLDLALLKDYGDSLENEKDPNRKAKYERTIEVLCETAERNRSKFSELRAQVAGEPSVAIQDVDVQLRKMNTKLDAILVGQEVILDELTDLRQDILDRFDAGEQAIINAVVERLDENQLVTVQVVLNGLDDRRIPENELQEILGAVQGLVAEIRREGVTLTDPALASGVERMEEVVKEPTLDVSHKLKLSVPIIPFILSYEGELGLASGLNLDKAWNRLVAKWKQLVAKVGGSS